MSEQFKKRLKSFAWRGGMMALAFILAWVAENIKLLQLDNTTTTIIGLAFGEISKAINNKVSQTSLY